MSMRSSSDILKLQTDLIFNISSLSKIVENSRYLGGNDGNLDLDKWIDSLSAATQTVTNLEIRLPIVALMKAGKSTVLNAIIQRDIVPSRSISMTTLPTGIRLVKGEMEARLEFATESIKKLDDVLVLALNKISQLDDKQLNDKFNSIPKYDEFIQRMKSCLSLKQLLNYLEDGEKSYIEGDTRINSALKSINDFVRIALKLEVHYGNNLDLQVTVPFSGSKVRDWAAIGSLILVDSAGTDEANMGIDFENQLDGELYKSSVILLVLDYTKLNDKFGIEQYKKKIIPHLEMIGKDKLYVIVNKIDRRIEEDDFPAESVKNFVCSFLDLNDRAKERIFEISALNYLRSQVFINYALDKDEKVVRESRQLQKFAEEVMYAGLSEEKRKKRLDKESLQDWINEAEDFIKDSGFQFFFENTIFKLTKSAAITAIKSQTSSCLNISNGLKKQLECKIQECNSDVTQLKRTREDLNNQLTFLKKIDCKEMLLRVEDLAKNATSLSAKIESATSSFADLYLQVSNNADDLRDKYAALGRLEASRGNKYVGFDDDIDLLRWYLEQLEPDEVNSGNIMLWIRIRLVFEHETWLGKRYTSPDNPLCGGFAFKNSLSKQGDGNLDFFLKKPLPQNGWVVKSSSKNDEFLSWLKIYTHNELGTIISEYESDFLKEYSNLLDFVNEKYSNILTDIKNAAKRINETFDLEPPKFLENITTFINNFAFPQFELEQKNEVSHIRDAKNGWERFWSGNRIDDKEFSEIVTHYELSLDNIRKEISDAISETASTYGTLLNNLVDDYRVSINNFENEIQKFSIVYEGFINDAIQSNERELDRLNERLNEYTSYKSRSEKSINFFSDLDKFIKDIY